MDAGGRARIMPWLRRAPPEDPESMAARKHPTQRSADPARSDPPAEPEARAEIRLRRLIPDASRRKRTLGVLAAGDFEWFLERERNLADRGNRVFSLLVVRPVRADPAELQKLARILSGQLRVTDLVGHVDGGALAMLLADTRSEGALVVAAAVDRAVSKLGIQVESTIFVYPCVDQERSEAGEAGDGEAGDGEAGDGEASEGEAGEGEPPADDADSGNGMHGRAGGNGATHSGNGAPGAGNGAAHPRNGAPRRSRRTGTHAVATPAWPMRDLWTRLSQPLPAWKRSLDLLLAGLGLVLLFPFLVIVAIAIRLDSPGPIFFTQKRAGRAAKPFTLYKFRSMVSDAERLRPVLEPLNEQSGPVFKIRHDPRITRVGRWMRRWSIDELPQLWNVLKGDMSLVGPRSPTFEELSEYESWQRRRLHVTGGITCIWQVSGRSQIGFREWMRMDMAYVSGHSLWLDLKLLARTIVAVITGRGAY